MGEVFKVKQNRLKEYFCDCELKRVAATVYAIISRFITENFRSEPIKPLPHVIKFVKIAPKSHPVESKSISG